ncbi:MAG: hypothetical protein JNN12_03695 [Bacteroidetes Order II. Incertae sedis bacterium]|nr:hypothetical protein [Bacteroidetes Order II. bacterium]
MGLQWLVVGGGVHGTFLSHSLMNHAQVAPSEIGVIDPHEAPLAMWTHCAKNVGMSVLRSTIVHPTHQTQRFQEQQAIFKATYLKQL